VLTFKNTYKKKPQWYAALEEGLDELRALGGEDVEVIHLLANTAKETTVICHLKHTVAQLAEELEVADGEAGRGNPARV
jgi:hypothetical protein